MKNNTVILLTAASMTGTTTVNSPTIALEQIYTYAIQAVWTGTPTGSFKLQASCDLAINQQGQGDNVVTNWTDIPNTTQAAGGAAGSYIWNMDGVGYRFVRLVYTNASSTGTVSANINLKGA